MDYLIPDHWFADQPSWLLLVVAAVAMLALVKGADWLVEGASGAARRLGIPPIIIGATILSLGTTSPEAAVSVMAAWSGQPGLALGNAVGSIIVDTGLIFGCGCVVTILPADRLILARQGWIQFGAAALLAGLCYLAYAMHGDDATLGRGVGALMLALLVAYILFSIKWGRERSHIAASGPLTKVDIAIPSDADTARRKKPASVWRLAGGVVIGLLIVLLSSRVLIGAVIVVAKRWGVPQVVIAATLVALGTSLPELATAIASIVKGHKGLLVGNVIGADILNVLFVIGASAVAEPLPIIEQGSQAPAIFLQIHLPAMLFVLILFRVFIAVAVRRGQFARWMGVPLLATYVIYLVLQFVIVKG